MGIIALAIFGLLGALRGYLSLQFADLAPEPKLFANLIFGALVAPISFRLKGGSVLEYFLIRGHPAVLKGLNSANMGYSTKPTLANRFFFDIHFYLCSHI
jgi:hypothetical protein